MFPEETVMRNVPDPLCRWTPVDVQRTYRYAGGSEMKRISIRTNSELILESLVLFQQGALHSIEEPSDFCWEIVVQQEETATPSASEIMLFSSQEMTAAYLSERSFFAIHPRRQYAAGFLSLPFDEVKRQEEIDQYLSLLIYLTRESMHSDDLSNGQTRVS